MILSRIELFILLFPINTCQYTHYTRKLIFKKSIDKNNQESINTVRTEINNEHIDCGIVYTLLSFHVVYQVARLLNPSCEGIRERIDLLGDLLSCTPLDSIPDTYDEMAQIIAATERNERFQMGPDGKRLLELTTAARSNLNVDLHNLDVEIQRQFGLHSVEVTGDGVRVYLSSLSIFVAIISFISRVLFEPLSFQVGDLQRFKVHVE